MPFLVSQSLGIVSAVAASATPTAVAVLAALYLLVVGPVLAACFYAIRRKDAGALERSATDVQRFIDLRERARAELAATGSLDRFIELKQEARKHLWRPATQRAVTAPRSKQVGVAAPTKTWLPYARAVGRPQRSKDRTHGRRIPT